MVCGESGCEACQGRGHWRLEVCPLDFVDDETWQLIELAELFKQGLPPVAGGTLDQAAVFVEAARRVWREQEHWRAVMAAGSQ